MVGRCVDRGQAELAAPISPHQAERGEWGGRRCKAVPFERVQRGARLRKVAACDRRVQLRAEILSGMFGVRVRPRARGMGDGRKRAAKHAQPAARRAHVPRIALPPPAVSTPRASQWGKGQSAPV